MARSSVVLVLLVVLTSITGTESIDRTFRDNEDMSSTSSSSSLDEDTKEPPTRVSASSSASSSFEMTTKTPSATMTDTFDSAALLEMYATPATAISTVTSTYRNWVGPWSISSDTSCYREAHVMDVCPSNFDRNEATNTCWTECPIEFPVECGMECIRQNSDCGLEVASKVSALAMAVFGTATFGVFGEMLKLGKKITWAVKCTNQLLLVMRGVIRYVRNVKTEDPQTSQQKLLLMLYQTNNVVTDIPMAIYACMGKDIPSGLRLSQIVLATTQWMLEITAEKKY
ncbi:hypothetical protein PRIC2_007760 [Phytophthora ramorum]